MGKGEARGKDERIAVPAMPMPLAVICCILNFLVPGFGTMIAGFSSFCCARNEDMGAATRFGSCCVSFGIGLLQLILTLFFLIGWIWSCVWGIFFVGMSSEYYHGNPPDGCHQPGVIVNTVSTGPVIVQQPQPQGYYGQPAMGATYQVQPAYPTQVNPGYSSHPVTGYMPVGYPQQQNYNPAPTGLPPANAAEPPPPYPGPPK